MSLLETIVSDFAKKTTTNNDSLRGRSAHYLSDRVISQLASFNLDEL